MNNWSAFLLVLLALVFAAECNDYELDDYDYESVVPLTEIDPDKIVVEITNTSHDINVTWRIQDNDKDPQCFTTQVQLKRQCIEDWQTKELSQDDEVGYLTLSTVSMKVNYDFRIRMKNWCVQHPWTNWTKIQSWGNNTGACTIESSSYLWVYILVTILPLTCFLLICLLTQQGIRKLILPEVPDPKNFKNKIMEVDQSQWWGNLTQWNDDCTTTDIEIIERSERKEQQQTLVIQPIDTIPEQHDSSYCIYSPEKLDDNMEVELSESVLGYIIL